MVVVATAVLGAAILGGVALDVVQTTLSPASGPGPLTKRWGRLLWSGMGRRLDRPTLRWWHLLGPGVLVATIGSWLVLFVAGWWLVLGAAGPVVDPATGIAAGPGQRLYMVVSTVSTLGLGDLVPITGAARAVTVVAAVSGLGLVTLSVTYVLPVLTAVTDRRVLATSISGVGRSASAIVEALDGAAAAERLLDEVGSSPRSLAQRHRSYPILHFFHSTDRAAALAPSIAALDEAVGMLAARTGPPRPSQLSVRRLRAAVDDLLDVTDRHLAANLPGEPPPTAGPTGSVPCRHSLDGHRRRLEALVVDDGWSWRDDVLADGSEPGDRRPSDNR